MPARPRHELIEELASRLGIPAAGSGKLTHDVLHERFTAALRQFAGAYPWPWLRYETPLVVSSSTGKATLPSDFMTPIGVYRTSNGLPIYAAMSTADHRRPNRITPYMWWIAGNELALRPIPSANLDVSLVYIREEPALANDNAVTLAPAHAQDAIVARAAYLCEVRRGYREDAASHQAEYEGLLRDLRDEASRIAPKKHIVEARSRLDYATWE